MEVSTASPVTSPGAKVTDTGQDTEDAETFVGKIVYNPDGSAFIIEGSESSDVESEVGSLLKEGAIVETVLPNQPANHTHHSSTSQTNCSGNNSSSCSGPIPQVLQAHHIVSRGASSSAAGNSLQGILPNQVLQENLKVPEVPVMHSYRVFSLRDQDKKQTTVSSSQQTAASSSQEEDDANNNNNNQQTNDSDTDESPATVPASLVGKIALTVPVKPILMCFICKISFGYAKSFVTHATTEHRLSLIEDEERLLGQKNTSAIIQGVGKDKDPLISFLEPKNKRPQPLIASASFGSTTASSSKTCTVAATSSSGLSVTGSSSPPSAVTSVNNNNNQSSLHQQFQQQLMAMAAAQAAAVAALRCQGQSSSHSSSSPFPGLSFPPTETAKESPSRPSSNGSLNLIMPKNLTTDDLDDKSSGVMTGDDCSELADLANLEKIAKAAAAAIQQQQELEGVVSGFTSNTSPNTSQSPHALTSSPKNLSQQQLLSQLGVSASDGSHGVQMMHSRNSCKTLKCPKCNWHYKYQETLEIHMKEKHPENEMNCMYCLTNQPHPRLARGETYTCGYKPYRCEVCNYSTTTKGNLSIHMQSDKHINNVQELQNGSLSASLVGNMPGNEHLMSSQAVAAAALLKSSASSVTSNPTGGSSNASSPGAIPASLPPQASSPKASPVSVPGGIIPPNSTPSGSNSSPSLTSSNNNNKPKATWRCDVCNYETNVARNLRIHLTSEKHSHNMMVLQQNVKHMQQLTALSQAGLLSSTGSAGNEALFHPSFFAALAASNPSPVNPGVSDSLQPEAALADMAYNHALLMMASQHQQQRAMAAVIQSQARSPNSFPPASLCSPGGQPTVDLEHPDPSLRLDAIPYDDSCHVFHCCICTTFTCDSIEILSQHIQKDRTRIREDEVLMAVGGSYICKLCQYKTNLKANFQLHCKTDKHLQRLQQVNHIKEGGDRTEWKIKYVNVSNPVQVRCNVCDYYTNSIHKLQLHSATSRHETAMRVFLHLQLSETIIRSASGHHDGKSKSLYFNCSICQHPTRSKITLVHHINTLKHMQHENMRQLKLQQQQHGHHSLPSKSLDEEIREMFHVKEMSVGDNINFADDARPEGAESSLQSPGSRPPSTSSSFEAATSSMDSMLKQALQEAHARTMMMNKGNDRESSSSSSCHSSPIHSCPFCHYTSSSESKIQQHIFNQHSKQSSSPVKQVNKKTVIEFLCPLCQEAFPEKAPIESHLIEVHNVNGSRVQKLMIMVEQKEVSSPNKSDNDSDDGPVSSAETFSAALLEQQASKFLRLGGGVDAASLPNISDRHVYKYRCHQCSLAFKTAEKLQLHSQYHLIRAATQCVLCSRSFRSLEALQRHMESSHQDMTDGEVETYRQSLLNNPLLGRQGGILDPATTELLRRESNRMESDQNDDENEGEGPDESMDTDEHEQGNTVEDYLNSQSMAENNYSDPDRKYKCHRCKVAFTRQSYLTSHNKTLLHRKGEKMSYPMEKYLDPNRPFKCDICKESFTQKNILLVHYNSVSHLHKLKQEQQKNRNNTSNNNNASNSAINATITNNNNNQVANDSASNDTSSPDEKKPYKCNICRVSFSLSSTLDIHVRSVLHQTRASKLNELALSGQVDLSLPLIERPESEAGKEQSSTPSSSARSLEQSFIEQQIQQQLQQQAALNALAVNQQMHQLIAAAAGGASLPSSSGSQGIFPCLRCGAVFTSQEGCQQHQQICCLLSNSIAKSSPASLPLQQKTDELNLPSSSHSLKTPTASEQLAAMRAASSSSNKFFASPSSTNLPSSVLGSSYRTKPPVYKHLLETWGFEIVMQFNEQHQQRRRKTAAGKENEESSSLPKENKTENQTESEGNERETDADPSTTENKEVVKREEEDPISSDKESDNKPVNHLPEVNRCKCHVCLMEFSSIWVLKAHQEEIHKDVVPLAAVESFASEFKEDFDKKHSSSNSINSSSNMNNNSSSNTCSASESAPVPAESEAVGQNDRRSTPAQLPNDSQTSSSGANNNMSSPPTGNPAPNANDLNAQMAAQIQFSQLLMSMGLAGMAMPGMPAMNAFAAMGIPPQMIPFMMGAQMDPVMAAALQASSQASGATPSPTPTASGSSSLPLSSLPDPMFAAQQKLLAQQQLSAAQQQKRARTRITDEQLKILRQYFDINNSPTEDALQEMSEKSGLPLKVIKHWFRNTLFKERQRNKDSPYNFNNPPSTFLNLEEYEKTGEAKVVPVEESSSSKSNAQRLQDKLFEKTSLPPPTEVKKEVKIEAESPRKESSEKDVKPQSTLQGMSSESDNKTVNHHEGNNQGNHTGIRDSFEYAKSFSMSPHSESSMSSVSTTDTGSQHHVSQQHAVQAAAAAAVQSVNQSLFGGNLQAFAAATGIPTAPLSSSASNPLQMALDAAHRSQVASASSLPSTPSSRDHSRDHSSPGSGSAPGKRANRTRFTDYQIKVLQEFFESNAYPKDDDLEYLSKLLNLSPRVIVVWFQNARQKARKVYENQPAVSEDDSNPGRFQRTPGLNYQCKKCMQVFQRYYELIKHQKSACFKDENPLAVQLKAAQEARQSSSSGRDGAPSPANNTANSSNSSIADNNNKNPTPTASSSGPATSPAQSPSSQGAFKCEKCGLVFPRFDLWREHQIVHIMNPNLFPAYPPTSPFGILQFEGQAAVAAAVASAAALPLNCLSGGSVTGGVKRKLNDDEDSQESFSGQSTHQGSQSGHDPPRDKRLRTTILPEQLDYLYQKYQIESNPSRKMLENIAKEVGLKKRVVQVWFQNTRARERKGQFRAHQQVIHKRCPFCRALFKARSALESHLATRHADQYTKGDINIDALPDGDPAEDAAEAEKGAVVPNELLQMRQYYDKSQSFIKKYMDEMVAGNPSETSSGNNSMKNLLEGGTGMRLPGESPLDLSKPVDLSRGFEHFSKFDSNGYESRSDNDSESDSDGEGDDRHEGDDSGANSPAPGSTTSSVTSPAAVGGGNGQIRTSSNSNSNNSANKRFRTQMTTVQLKVMKSIFAEYKTPSMAECETLGREVGLPKRVVQVWFQNARAKEKKAKLAFVKSFGQDMPDNSCKPAEECNVCGVKYNLKFSSTSMQDHLFSRKHIENLKTHIDSVKKGIENPDDSVDFPGASSIIMTAPGDPVDSDARGSQSATNLMQHLQMMGLAGSLAGVPGLSVNGDTNKNNNNSSNNSSNNNKDSLRGMKPDASESSGNNGSEGPDPENNSFAFMFANNPGLHNAYYSAAAGGFLPNAMFGTSVFA